MDKKTKYLNEITVALKNDELWRAREIYKGLIRICGYDPKVYFEYAQLLLKMREDLAAGRYFFLSGNRSDESKRCIKIFLNRYQRKKLKSITGQFPSAAQFKKCQDFPEPLRKELIELELEDDNDIERNKKSIINQIIEKGIIGIFIIIIISIPFGLFYIVQLLFKLFTK